jgi:hypothetical protein
MMRIIGNLIKKQKNLEKRSIDGWLKNSKEKLDVLIQFRFSDEYFHILKSLSINSFQFHISRNKFLGGITKKHWLQEKVINVIGISKVPNLRLCCWIITTEASELKFAKLNLTRWKIS